MRKIDNKILTFLVAWFLGLVVPAAAAAAAVGGLPVGRTAQVLPLAQVERLVLPTVPRQETAGEDLLRAENGEPYRFAVPRRVDLTPDNSGTWEMLPGTDRLWRLRVHCPDVLSLNLGFSEFQLPLGAELRVYPSDGSGPGMTFAAGDVRDHRQLWTPVLLTSDLVVELKLPAGAGSDWRLRLGTVGCGYRFFGEDPAVKSGSCNIDVVCPEGDDWRDEIATVGVYTVDGTWKCTGAMINNSAQDERPLFLTAHHCEVSENLAPSVVVYWNFESPTCGQQGGGNLDDFSTGSVLLASNAQTDFTLLELAENPDPTFGVNFAGWDRSSAAANSAVAIHHPSVDEKSISFEDDPLTVTSYIGAASPGDGTHLRVADWDLGTTEGGSSGSPLFNADKLIIGQLHGGYAACGNELPDWYGRFSVSWQGGGTPQTRLSTWLDPGNLGTIILPLLDPEDGPIDPPVDNANIRITSIAPNPFQDFLTVTVEMDRAAAATAKVYDISGRLRADLGARNLAEGDNPFSWDGYAADGSRVPAGVYVLVMESEGKSARQAFVRLN